jgi:hypothetical protein
MLVLTRRPVSFLLDRLAVACARVSPPVPRPPSRELVLEILSTLLVIWPGYRSRSHIQTPHRNTARYPQQRLLEKAPPLFQADSPSILQLPLYWTYSDFHPFRLQDDPVAGIAGKLDANEDTTKQRWRSILLTARSCVPTTVVGTRFCFAIRMLRLIHSDNLEYEELVNEKEKPIAHVGL